MVNVEEKVTTRKVQFDRMIKTLSKNHNAGKSKKQQLKTSQLRALVNSYNFSETYKPESIVAFVGEQFPNEVLYHLGIRSLNIETMAALFSKSDNVKEYLQESDNRHLSKDICSNIRMSFGISNDNCYPSPDITIANTHPCDALAKLLYQTGETYHSKFYSIDTPNIYREDSINYLAKQLEVLVHKIAEDLKLEYRLDNFIQTISYSNQAKKYYLKTLELCKTHNLNLIALELFEIVECGFWGMKEAVNVCESIYEEAVEACKNSPPVGTRLLWIGQKPNYSSEIIDYLHEKGIEIFFLGMVDSSHYLLINEEDPYRSIAKRSIKYLWDPTRFQQDIKKMKEDYSIDGVVLLNAWGCRNMLGVNQMLRNVVTESKIKYLGFDIDYMDRDKFAFSQVKNRIDAFLEIL